MGISGLYKWLDSIKRIEHIKKYKGKILGIDTYSWLHKGAFSCAIELVHGTPTTKYVDYCMERVKMLQYHGITPYLVFDGNYLPSKAGTEAEREARREESRKKGLALMETNKTAAMEILQKAIDVTPLMARNVIEACKALKVPYVVAPYEADAQLYYLEKTGVIDGVISEDSDLLVFGVRLLVTKMDRFGDCVEVNRDDFASCKAISLAGWTDTEFRQMAILSGCDYLPSIKGIGVKKAHGYVRSHKTLERILRAIRLDGKMSVPKDYMEKFQQAELTFLHQRVWCPKREAMVMCTEPETPLSEDALVFIGGALDDKIAHGIALGDLDPMTNEPFGYSLMPKYRSKPLSATALKKPCIVSKPTKSIASFFKPTTSTPLRTPLQAKNANIQIIRKAFSAPRPASVSTPLAKKRVLSEETVKTDVPTKKSRLSGSDGNVKVTSDRSSFFQTPNHIQSRRPLGNIENQSPIPVDSIKRSINSGAKRLFVNPVPGTKKELTDLEKAIRASLAHSTLTPLPPVITKELGDFERAVQASLETEFLPLDYDPTIKLEEDTSIQKVAVALKAEFSFKASPPGRAPKKLAEFVERQRVGSTPPKRGSRLKVRTKRTELEEFRSGSATAKISAQIPHTVDESQDSTLADWPDLGVQEDMEETLGNESQSQSQGVHKVLGEGGFAKFRLQR